jgi:hypothetical protein
MVREQWQRAATSRLRLQRLPKHGRLQLHADRSKATTVKYTACGNVRQVLLRSTLSENVEPLRRKTLPLCHVSLNSRALRNTLHELYRSTEDIERRQAGREVTYLCILGILSHQPDDCERRCSSPTRLPLGYAQPVALIPASHLVLLVVALRMISTTIT